MKVAGQWRYVYRAIDQFGQVIEIFVPIQRHGRAARRLFEPAIGTTKTMPMEIITDLAPVYPQPRWKSFCRQLGIAPIGTPTTVSKPITAG